MGGIAVVYKSKYGSTKQYAQWIAQKLDYASLFEVSQIKPEQLALFDVIVYGGGLYAGGINGVSLVTKNPCKNLVVFTVGLANPDTTDYSEVLSKNFSGELLAKTKVFHLRGGISYSGLSLLHKGIMAIFNKAAAKKDRAKMSDEERAIVETGGNSVDFTDKSTVAPIVAHVKATLGENS